MSADALTWRWVHVHIERTTGNRVETLSAVLPGGTRVWQQYRYTNAQPPWSAENHLLQHEYWAHGAERHRCPTLDECLQHTPCAS